MTGRRKYFNGGGSRMGYLAPKYFIQIIMSEKESCRQLPGDLWCSVLWHVGLSYL